VTYDQGIALIRTFENAGMMKAAIVAPDRLQSTQPN